MRILLAWELGGGFGHLAPLRALAQELQKRGHQCVFAVRHLESAAAYLGGIGGPLLQAPVSILPNDPPPFEHVSYASVLYGCGFHRVPALSSRLRAWRDLIDLTGCKALIAHHSPTPLLAARSLSMPAGLVGSGFNVPPPRVPMPGFHAQDASSDPRVAAIDGAVLQISNQSLAKFGAKPMDTLSQLISGAHSGLFTYPELDHYPESRAQPRLGLPDFSRGARADWGLRREPRVFAYLRPFPGMRSLLEALYRRPLQVLARVAEVDPGSFSAMQRDGFVIINKDVDIRTVAADCDAYINYGAHGTMAEMLLAGKPGLLIPNTLERSLVTGRAVTMGTALAAATNANTAYQPAIDELLENPALRRAAEQFRQRHKDQVREDILPRWCDEFLHWAGATAPSRSP